jgi:hypothetical protein
MLHQLGEKLSLDFTIWTNFKPWLSAAGFGQIQAVDIVVPIGPWAGRIGHASMVCFRRMLMSYKSGLLGLGIVKTEEEFERAVELRMNEIEHGQESIVYTVYVAKR